MWTRYARDTGGCGFASKVMTERGRIGASPS